MTLEAGKELDRRYVMSWLYEVYRSPRIAYYTYSDEQQTEFAHDALVLLKEQPEIVQCKDCKNAVVYDDNEVICAHIDSNGNDKHSIDWFCADGERK